jgi:predicted flap endonuclease-1-like 5' DNA nuclease
MIENLRAEVLVGALAVTAAGAGVVGWLIHRLGEDARRRAHEASCREFVRAAGAARDRARREAEQADERVERIKREHAACPARIEELTVALVHARQSLSDGESAAQADTDRQLNDLRKQLTESRKAAALLERRLANETEARSRVEAQVVGLRAGPAGNGGNGGNGDQSASDGNGEKRANGNGAPTWLLAKPTGRKDDLQAMHGVGPALERDFNRLGIFHYRQLARMTTSDVDWITARVTTLPGAIKRYRLAEQAKKLDRSS